MRNLMIVATTGFFDGVHLGHRAVIKKLAEIAHQKGVKSEVITFWPHPRSVLQQDAYNLRLLTTLEEKKKIFKSLKIDRVRVLEFTKDFSKLSTEQFVKQYLIGRFKVETLVIGYDHKIGHNTRQSQMDMIEICKSSGVEVIRLEEFFCDGEVVSSTKIRKQLEAGEIKRANEFLGYNYSLDGVVVKGNGLGRTIGFPTANLQLYAPLKMVPADGVYAVRVYLDSYPKKEFSGVCNIGCRPTIGENNAKTIETNIFEFDEDIYGLDLKIEFVARIRDERKFNSLEQLKMQLQRDKNDALSML